MIFLVTGAAGFIGFHTAKALLRRGDTVVGFDAVNDYYDVTLKEARIVALQQLAGRNSDGRFSFIKGNIADQVALQRCFDGFKVDRVIHLAAQAGVRHSLTNPQVYIESNLVGFANILEACRHNNVQHLTYASTSSVYGANLKLPFSEADPVDHPLQLYAATKRANELMAHAYSHLYKLPTTGLRFFTVYGPWGRPDMALFLFTKNILEGKPIAVFNYGKHTRDFTYIDDIVEGILRVSNFVPSFDSNWNPEAPAPHKSSAPFRIFNIGNSAPIQLTKYIEAIEEATGKKATIHYLPMQAGDVADTCADVTELDKAVGFVPATSYKEGIRSFVEWYMAYYGRR